MRKIVVVKEPMSFIKIGELLGISNERARQIEKSALKKIRENPELVSLFDGYADELREYLKPELRIKEESDERV